MSTLTDRYVWGRPAGRAAAPADRPRARGPGPGRRRRRGSGRPLTDLEPGGRRDGPAAIERAALVELGDPELLAARYTDRTLALIRPRYYGDWRRLLSVLLPIVVPIVAITVIASARFRKAWAGSRGGGPTRG